VVWLVLQSNISMDTKETLFHAVTPTWIPITSANTSMNLKLKLRFDVFFLNEKKEDKVHYIRYNRPPVKIMNIITLFARPKFSKNIPKSLCEHEILKR
jgi:hypothetical protein